MAFGADAEPTPRKMNNKMSVKAESKIPQEFNRFDECMFNAYNVFYLFNLFFSG